MVHADVIFRGGRLFVGSPTTGPVAADVAVRDGVIIAVGPRLHDLVGPATEQVDAVGRLVVPGFHDSHVHPVQAGVEALQCDLSAATDAGDCVRRVAAYAAEHPDEPWIVGAGWALEFFPGGIPTAAALDAVVPDRPVVLSNRDHHGSWVNSRTLQVAGITASTPDPVDGRIERDPHGQPTGMLHEGAVALLAHVRPAVSAELVYRGLLHAQGYLFSLGITGWQDALVGTGLSMPDGFDAYLRAEHDRTLRARVTGALWWEREGGLAQLPALAERRARAAAEADPARLRMDVVKIMIDGITENFTAAVSLPYLDSHGHPTSNRGLSFFPPGELAAHVTALDAAGFGIHFHALGDRAVAEALDALRSARDSSGPSGGRHQLAHLQIVGPTDVARFADLGATANLQPLWARHEPQLDELSLPYLHPSLASRHYPFGELERAGVRLAAGSDWPVSSPDPLAGIRVAVTRRGPASSSPPLGGPDQALSMSAAFAAYTSGGAWVSRRDDITGRIAEGLRADLAVVDGDPFATGAESLDGMRVASTWVDGERVFER
jgi:predicted amidohydrolase YtcJ